MTSWLVVQSVKSQLLRHLDETVRTQLALLQFVRTELVECETLEVDVVGESGKDSRSELLQIMESTDLTR